MGKTKSPAKAGVQQVISKYFFAPAAAKKDKAADGADGKDTPAPSASRKRAAEAAPILVDDNSNDVAVVPSPPLPKRAKPSTPTPKPAPAPVRVAEEPVAEPTPAAVAVPAVAEEDGEAKRPAKRARRVIESDDEFVPSDGDDGDDDGDDALPTTTTTTTAAAASGAEQQQPGEELRRRFVAKALAMHTPAGPSASPAAAASPAASASAPTSFAQLFEGGLWARMQEEKAKPRGKRKGKGKGKGKGAALVKLTPLEEQVVSVKAAHRDVLLAVETGYKYRFFGEDAVVASKLLNIGCFLAKNFMNASVPTQRLHIHLRRLVDAGHKVGIVSQTETAALKAAGANKSAPFTRQLTELFTSGTMVSEHFDTVVGATSTDDAAPVSTYVMCVWEECVTKHVAGTLSEPAEEAPSMQQTRVSLVCVDTMSGDVLHDSFFDNYLRGELDTRLVQLQPQELVLPPRGMLSRETARVLRAYASGRKCRIEEADASLFANESPIATLADFYGTPAPSSATATDSTATATATDSTATDSTATATDATATDATATATDSTTSTAVFSVFKLSHRVAVCLCVLQDYLSQFSLDSVLRITGNVHSFGEHMHMRLDGHALHNLDIADGGVDKSLVWLLRHTKTAFGTRLLKRWIFHPLTSRDHIVARQEAVQVLAFPTQDTEPLVKAIVGALTSVPDLERGIMRVQYGKCSPVEFVAIVRAFLAISRALPAPDLVAACGHAPLLRDTLARVPDVRATAQGFLEQLCARVEATTPKSALFVDARTHPEVFALKRAINGVRARLDEHLVEIRATLGQPKLNFRSVLKEEYLVEVRLTQVKHVPSEWSKINGTKQFARFRTPRTRELMDEMQRHVEELDAASERAWRALLRSFSSHYADFRLVVTCLAELDCLCSLAQVAQQPGYVQPTLAPDGAWQLHIEDGRHPVVEAVQPTYVPNSIDLRDDGIKQLIVTGPNMGGKSSFIRQVALIVVMAQIGSWVPAASATLSVFDAIYTRMGASDNIATGHSTFMVEVLEAGAILRQATARSLVIMDELGRGTSTHDGVAIAYATLEYLAAHTRCAALFVTHYPLLAELEHRHPTVGNAHMSFVEAPRAAPDDVPTITFLYRLVHDVAKRSYGLNVAHLAGLPASILKVAAAQSAALEARVRESTDAATLAHVRDLHALLARAATTSDEDMLAAAAALHRKWTE